MPSPWARQTLLGSEDRSSGPFCWDQAKTTSPAPCLPLPYAQWVSAGWLVGLRRSS